MPLIHCGSRVTLPTLAIAGISDGDTAYIFFNSRSRCMEFDILNTDATDMVNHPYKLRPDDYGDGGITGVWVEKVGEGSPDVWNGSQIATGSIASTNYGAAAGSAYDLDDAWIKLGGSNVTAAGTAAGIFLGLDSGGYKAYIGNGASSYLKYDIVNGLAIAGTITGGSLIVSDTGAIYSTGKSSYADTDAGFFIGYDTDAYKLNIGDDSSWLKWSGSALSIQMASGETFDLYGSLNIKSGGNVTIDTGGDLILSGDYVSGNTAILTFDNYYTAGGHFYFYMRPSGTVSKHLFIYPQTDGEGILYIGGGTPAKSFSSVDVNVTSSFNAIAYGATNYGASVKSVSMGSYSYANLYATYGLNVSAEVRVYSGATRYIDFCIDEASKVRIDSLGYVGINTTAPDKVLEINTGASDNGIRISYNDANGSAANYSDIITGADGDLTITTVDSDGAAGHIALMPDGNVGIDTTSPNQKLTVEGTMSLKEQAAANADTAAYGQIWVANSTPNELWFTDDAGTDTQISSHPLDAPPDLYTYGPGIDWMGKRVQKYLGVIFWQKIDGTIMEETFDAYNARCKDRPDHTDYIKRDWNTEQLAKLKAEKMKEVIEEEIAAENAFESVEITKEVQTGTEEKQSYSYDKGGRVILETKVVPVMESQGTGEFEKRLKSGVDFDSKTGKFTLRKTLTEAEVDALNLEVPAMPPWMAAWIEKQKVIEIPK